MLGLSISEKFMQDMGDHHDSHVHLQRTGMTNGSSTGTKGFSAVISSGGPSESSHLTVSRQCERAFFRLLMSGKFASFCNMLSENFHGLKIEKILDFSIINTRIKEGAYEHKPMLFSSDIQQVLYLFVSFNFQCKSFFCFCFRVDMYSFAVWDIVLFTPSSK